MTHSLHRRGSPVELCRDYVVLVMPARGINLEGSEPTMQKVWEIISHHARGLANYGNLTEGNSHRISLEALQQGQTRLAHAVFTDRRALKDCLAELKEAELGPSVVISGLYEDSERLCEELGLKPHTVNLSLGVHGRTEKLPPAPVLEITTMCGHAMVAPGLVKLKVAELRRGETSLQEAAVELSRQCECGIFNPRRAEDLLRRLVDQA